MFSCCLFVPQSPLNWATGKEFHQCPQGQTCLVCRSDANSWGRISRGETVLCPCRRLVEKGIKAKSKLLSACLTLSPRYSCLSERICRSLGLPEVWVHRAAAARQSAILQPWVPCVMARRAGGSWWSLMASSVLGCRQTHRVVTPAGSRQISWRCNRSRRSGNYSLFWRMPLVWQSDVFAAVWNGFVVELLVPSPCGLSGFPPSWRLHLCIWYDRHGEQ